MRRRQQGLARRHRAGVVVHALHAVEEVLQRRRQAGRGVGQHIVDLLDLRRVGRVLAALGLRLSTAR